MEHMPDDEMSRLYASFMEAYNSGGDLSGFSKDDLIDVYDFSRGIPDDFISEEVLSIALMRFPNSRDLVKRKAFFYHDLGHDSICDIILMSLPETSFVRTMAHLRNEWRLFGNEPQLSEYLDDYAIGSIEDGDIIFTVDIFGDAGLIDLVVRYAETFSNISQYPSTIYNELYNAYYDKGMYEKALEFGQKLTEIDPFNAAAWTELANLYLMKMNRPDVAAECAEYAIAIDPEDVNPRMIKALSLYDSDPIGCKNMVAEALAGDVKVPSACYVGAFIDFYEGKERDAVEKITQSLDDFSLAQRRETIDLLLRKINKPLDCDMRDRIHDLLIKDDSINAEAWVENLLRLGCLRGAYELYSVASSVWCYDTGNLQAMLTAAEVMYRLNLFGKTAEVLAVYVNETPLADVTPPAILLYALSLYRCWKGDVVRSFVSEAKMVLEQAPSMSSLADGLLRESVIPRLSSLLSRIDGDETVAESSFDPYVKD